MPCFASQSTRTQECTSSPPRYTRSVGSTSVSTSSSSHCSSVASSSSSPSSFSSSTSSKNSSFSCIRGGRVTRPRVEKRDIGSDEGWLRLGREPPEDANPIAPARARRNLVNGYARASRDNASSTVAQRSNDCGREGQQIRAIDHECSVVWHPCPMSAPLGVRVPMCRKM